MKVFNLRFGFATNSSSVHSLIFRKEDELIEDDLIEGSEFGWENFTAASDKSKRNYLGALLYSHVSYLAGPSIGKTVAESWSGVHVDDAGYVDHESQVVFPREWDGKGLNQKFFEEYKNYILQDNLVIIGGNDNLSSLDEDHPLRQTGRSFCLPLFYDGHSEVVARFDEEYKYWTLFDRKYGTKICMSFDDLSFKPVKSSYPELVDIKITDYCPYDCKFCYQGSTTNGIHAPIRLIESLIYKLGSINVFEVAIGGGEPTLHPDFVKILWSCKFNGIVPNFSTRNISWLKSDKSKEILDLCGRFAYSISSSNDIESLYLTMKYHNHPLDKVSLQLVMGTVDKYTFTNILRDCSKYGFTLTLLGYKDVGRGKDFKPINYDWMLEDLIKFKKDNYLSLGIDTAIASEFEPQLKKRKISDLYIKLKRVNSHVTSI